MILEPNHNKDEVRDPVTGDIIDGAPFLVKPVPLQDTPIRRPAKSVVDGELSNCVIVWETDRPFADSILGEESIRSLTRDELAQRFRTTLYSSEEFLSWDSFWAWFDSLDEEGLKQYYDRVREELKRANGRVPTFNVHLKNLSGSHNNVLLLGSVDQAAGAVFYICPYMGKKKMPLAESLSIISHAMKYVVLNPSVADDSGTAERTVKHVLQRILNRMNMKIELSSHQVAARLLNLPTILTTESHVYVKPSSEIAMSNVLKYQQNTIGRYILDKETLEEESIVGMGEEDIDPRELIDEMDEAEETEEDRVFIAEDDEEGLDPFVLEQAGEGKAEIATGPSPEKQPGCMPDSALRAMAAGVGRYKPFTIERPLPDSNCKPLKKFLPMSLIYPNRGTSVLKYFSRYELAATMEVKEKPSSDASTPYFSMAPSFELSANNAYFVMLKQKTPILTSKMPKTPGKVPPETKVEKYKQWKRNADKFAEYILTMFRPEDQFCEASKEGTSNPYGYSFEDLLSWIKELREDDNVFSKFRLQTIHRTVMGLRSKQLSKTMLCALRGRNRSTWTVKKEFPVKKSISQDKILFDEDYFALTGQECSNRMDRVEKLGKQIMALPRTATERPSEDNVHSATGPAFEIADLSQRQIKDRMQEVAISMIEVAKSLTSETHSMQDIGPKNIPPNSPSKRSNKVSLNQRQALLKEAVLNAVCPHLDGKEQGGNDNCKLFLVTGCAGTGKSEVLKAICEDLVSRGFGIFKTTINNINAIHIGGMTTASVLDYVRKKDGAGCSEAIKFLNDEELLRFRSLTNIGKDGATKVLALDEISNYAPFVLANLSNACKQATGIEDQPFGGLVVLFMGDLYQLGPVKAGHGLALGVLNVVLNDYRHMVEAFNFTRRLKKHRIPVLEPDDDRVRPDHPYSLGAQIMTSVRWFHLNQQVRAKTDPHHTSLVEKLGRGESLSIDDLKPYREYSQEDATQEEWLRAPMIVATNHEKLLLSHFRALELAKHTMRPLVRWRSNTVGIFDSPCGPLDEQDPALFELFLESADAYLSATVSKQLGLVNATKVRLHSLVAEDPQDYQILQDAKLPEYAGKVLTLSSPPAVINIEVPPESLKMLPATSTAALESLSLVPGKVVIPLVPRSSRREPVHLVSMTNPLDKRYDAQVYPHFPIELAFAITVHKAEGQTFEKVIVALSKRWWFNFSHAGIYVALSRVKEAECMRFLISGTTAREKQDSISYLQDLRPDPGIGAFFSGFGPVWSEDSWKTKGFCDLNAVLHFIRAFKEDHCL